MHILAIAGGWLKQRDHVGADRFAKALVLCNPDVPLAREGIAGARSPLMWEFDLELD